MSFIKNTFLILIALLIIYSCNKTNDSSDDGMRSYSFNVNSKKYDDKGYCGGLYGCGF